MTEEVGVAPQPTDTTAPAATPAEIQAKMYKVKVDGVEREVDETELLRGYSHSAAANERMRQAQEQRAQAEEVLRIFKENPQMAFQKLGKDVKSFAEQVLRQEMEDAMLSPQDKELRDLRRMAQEIKAQEQAAKEAQEKAAEDSFRNQVAQELQTGIMTALASGDLPKNEFTVARMAYYMESSIQAGFTNVRPQDVVPYVKQEYEREVKKLFSDMEGDKLLNFLGDDAKKIIKAHIAKSGAKKNNTLAKPVKIEREPERVDRNKFKSFFRGQ